MTQLNAEEKKAGKKSLVGSPPEMFIASAPGLNFTIKGLVVELVKKFSSNSFLRTDYAGR